MKTPKPAPQTTTTTVQQYSPEEAARRAALMAEAERVYQANAGSVDAARALVPSGPSADTQTSQDLMRRYAAEAPWAEMTGMLPGALQFGLQGVLDPTSSPGFQATLDTATRKIDERFMSPTGPFAGIRSAFTAGNSGGSGSREGIAMGMAGRDYLNTIGDVTGQLTSQAYGQGLDVFSRTLGMAPGVMQSAAGFDMLPANIHGALGQQTEGYAEQQRQHQLSQLNAPWQALGPYAQIVSGMGSSQSTQSSTATPAGAQANPMAPIGGAMLGASLFPANPLIGAGAGLLLSLFK